MKETPGARLRLKDPEKIEEVITETYLNTGYVLEKEIFSEGPLDFMVLCKVKGKLLFSYHIEKDCPKDFSPLYCIYANPDLEQFDLVENTRIIEKWSLFSKICLLEILFNEYLNRILHSGVTSKVKELTDKQYSREIRFIENIRRLATEKRDAGKYINKGLKRMMFLLSTRGIKEQLIGPEEKKEDEKVNNSKKKIPISGMGEEYLRPSSVPRRDNSSNYYYTDTTTSSNINWR
jgi:hypothetical protein